MLLSRVINPLQIIDITSEPRGTLLLVEFLLQLRKLFWLCVEPCYSRLPILLLVDLSLTFRVIWSLHCDRVACVRSREVPVMNGEPRLSKPIIA